MKDIIEMAQEAGFDPHDMSANFTCNLKDIERFAALVRADAIADEREACAKVCEGYTDNSDADHESHGYACAAAIRARKNT